jgi:glycosyltransferase involved in cell wall biosynthesis
MPPFTALLHTKNDALRLGRALETLLPCAEILIVDHQSTDATQRIARQYGARTIETDKVLADHRADAQYYLDLPRHDWILCLEPNESLTEALQASLFEWSVLPSPRGMSAGPAFSVFVRQQTGERRSAPETRLIPCNWPLWNGHLPAHEPSAVALEGDLLRLAFP